MAHNLLQIILKEYMRLLWIKIALGLCLVISLTILSIVTALTMLDERYTSALILLVSISPWLIIILALLMVYYVQSIKIKQKIRPRVKGEELAVSLLAIGLNYLIKRHRLNKLER